TLVVHTRFLCIMLTRWLYQFFPYTTLFRSCAYNVEYVLPSILCVTTIKLPNPPPQLLSPSEQPLVTVLTTPEAAAEAVEPFDARSEEHTSELQSRFDIVCRLLLEKKNTLSI